MTNIIEDIVKLGGVTRADLDRVCKKAEHCICHAVQESIKNLQDTTLVDIGIGQLVIKRNEDFVQYRFIPSSDFEEELISTIENKQSPIIKRAEESLSEKLLQVYSELL